MLIQEALQWGILKLKKAGVETPVLDAEVLLVHALQSPGRATERLSRNVQDRAWLYAHPEMVQRGNTVIQYRKMIARRARREPVAYIVEHKEFYGLDFLVNRKVLVPRPETELSVERAIDEIQVERLKMKNIVVVDVGTGSGAIAVAVANQYSLSLSKGSRLRPAAFARTIRFLATDISAAALRVAKKNARRHGVLKQIKFLKGNLLEPLKNVILNGTKWSEGSHTTQGGKRIIAQDVRFLAAAGNDKVGELIVVANLPYLPTSEWREAMPEVRKWEPRGALDGGNDGLRYYREMFEQLQQFVILRREETKNLSRIRAHIRVRSFDSGRRPSLRMTLICEICPEQAEPLKKLARGFFPRAQFQVVKDLARRNRVVIVRI